MISWDDTTNSPDVDETDGRSYISTISEVIVDASETCEGRAKNDMGEARMDIVDSEMGYLGFQDSESYGLTWKVTEDDTVERSSRYRRLSRQRGVCPSLTLTTNYEKPLPARSYSRVNI